MRDLEKCLMNDIFVAGIYQWILPKLAFQSFTEIKTLVPEFCFPSHSEFNNLLQ